MNEIKKASVILWEKEIGTIELRNDNKYYFKYNKAFSKSGIEVSPLNMKLREEEYCFDIFAQKANLPDEVTNAIKNAFIKL